MPSGGGGGKKENTMDRPVLVADANLQEIAETQLHPRDLIARSAEGSTEIVDVRSIPRVAEPTGTPVPVDVRRESLNRHGRGDRKAAPVGRRRLHSVATVQIAAQLRRMGLDVQATSPLTGADLLVNDTVRISVRAALRTARQQRVQVGERLYHYQRHSWQFNFHRHGRVGRRYCDYFICLPVALGHTAPNLHEALIIPWKARRGKTLDIPRQPYEGWYAKYRDAWEQLRRRCEAARRARHVEPTEADIDGGDTIARSLRRPLAASSAA